ncbi:MAG: hypothetical protein GY808_02220 [Gammaproteobacteria bacterium]|nr:hypothetical protein [Gammaproteobacteria bacterium]
MNHFKHIMLNNRILSIFVLFITLFLTISCSSENGPSVNNSGLVYCSEGSPDSFNPQVEISLTSFDANARVLFNRLIEVDTETGNMARSLATSWVKPEDNTVYTFTLRKNVHFHSTAWFTPTRTFNSSDVVFSFNRQLDKKHYLHEVQGRAYSPDGYLMAELMKEDLHKIGVQTTNVSHEWVSFLNKVSNGEHQTAILGWVVENQDTGKFLSSLLSCSARISKTNRTFWCNKIFDDLIKQAQETTAPERQQQLYYEALELFRTELPLLPIGSGTPILATNMTVKNLTIRPTGGISFSGVYKETSL